MPLTRVGKWTVLYGIVAVEVAAITGTYYVWHNMNVDQDFRKKMNTSHPRVLEAYYRSCTLVGIQGVKEKDLETWNSQK